MQSIKFGTDGWRAIIAREFTVENVARVSSAISSWLLNKEPKPRVVVGYDCRFGGKMFAETVAKVLALKDIHVFLSPDFVSTPMISNGVLALEAHLGIIITASHNPPEYNGLKVKGMYGGPAFESDLKDIEALIPGMNEISLDSIHWDELINRSLIEYVDLENIYFQRVRNNFDLSKIKTSGFKFAFDAMYGAGQRVIKKILPGIKCLHCSQNPFFNGMPPEPLHSHLIEFSEKIKSKWNIDAGLAVDGDADRIAMYDSQGNYIDSHHIILLLIHYLAGYKKLKGKIVTGFSSTVKVEKLASHYHLEVQRVKIGFKQISEVMLKEKVLVGGEESGGISILGNIPERDGIWMGLTLFQFMAESGKKIEDLLDEIVKITGPFVYERQDLKVERDVKNKILKKCRETGFSHFGDFEVVHTEDMDGFKFFFNKDEWLMIRPSGTEPILRMYAEAETAEKARAYLKAGYAELIIPEENG